VFENAFPGLSAAEFADIHQAVLEAMGFVLRPVVLFEPKPEDVDDLYGEAVSGSDPFVPLPEIGASIRYKPAKESLTRHGLKVEAEILLFIPRGEILRWEAANERTLLPEYLRGIESWEVEALGKRYNVFEAKNDPLPVATGATEDYIGLVVTGYKER
jgi:hypothetical protein